jgi:DnaJ-domain-containing protein 1
MVLQISYTKKKNQLFKKFKKCKSDYHYSIFSSYHRPLITIEAAAAQSV